MTKITYKTEIVDGRCYFNDGDKYVLVDTGYGKTVAIDGHIGEFKALKCDKDGLQSFNPTLMPNGKKIGGIICPMNGYNAMIRKDTVTIDDESTELPACEWFIPFESPFASIIHCKVEGSDKILFFDSGMKYAVIDDNSLIIGKDKKESILEWIGMEKALAEVPYYNGTLEFPCGFRHEGVIEHDCIHFYVSQWKGIQGFLGLLCFFDQFDVYISTVGKKRGLALVARA